MRPAPLAQADLSQVRVVFTDVDGTLTSKGRLTSSTLRALEWLVAHQVELVLVSGRPSGWGEAWARQLPVRGVIVENGGVTYAWRAGALHKLYAEGPAERVANRRRLTREVARVLQRVRGAKLSMDSAATEVDLAVDYAEDAGLGPTGADRIEALLHPRGVTAVRSSVHVNCWLGRFDKLSATRAFLRREFKTTLKPGEKRFVYVGDSFNDEPMFRAFPLSIGVANVADVLGRLQAPPRFITRAREGRGFGEVADAVVRARRRRKR